MGADIAIAATSKHAVECWKVFMSLSPLGVDRRMAGGA
jgi:hypothetical protein